MQEMNPAFKEKRPNGSKEESQVKRSTLKVHSSTWNPLGHLFNLSEPISSSINCE